MRAQAKRGQTMAMMAVTMLVVALMVALTLGIGMRVREKAEVQTLADVSAYSGAVAAARTFNSIALLNRVSIAHMVTIVSTEALDSWAGYHIAALQSAADRYTAEMALLLPLPCWPAYCAISCCPKCPRPNVCDCPCPGCIQLAALVAKANAEIARIKRRWDTDDDATAATLDSVLQAATDVYNQQRSLFNDLRDSKLKDQALANAIVQKTDAANRWAGELTAPPYPNSVNLREVSAISQCPPGSPELACDPPGTREIAIKAAMGARWHAFDTARSEPDVISDEVTDDLDLNPGEVVIGHDGRTAYVPSPVNPHAGATGYAEGLLSEDHGPMELKNIIACRRNPLEPMLTSATTNLYSSPNGNANHSFGSNGGGAEAARHTTACAPGGQCGIWPNYLDLNPGHLDPADPARFQYLYGQPKITAVVERDYNKRDYTSPNSPRGADPWNLFFTFQIGRNSQESFDNHGLTTARTPLSNSTDISRQTAIATGFVYYHRNLHWKEPPNFFNPYWRATLVSSAIDLEAAPGSPSGDIQTAVGPGSTAASVVNLLYPNGFKGWQ